MPNGAIHGASMRKLIQALSTFHPLPLIYYSVHDFVKMNPLYVVIQDVRKFLKETNEIVIMDFHRFPKGFEVQEPKQVE